MSHSVSRDRDITPKANLTKKHQIRMPQAY